MMESIRTHARIVVVSATLLLGACGGTHESPSQRQKEANSPAGKVGQAAYHVTKATGKVLKAAGKELAKAGHQAREGWKQSARRDREKNK